MANVAADLRQATLAVLRSWCHDFGLKPQGKKDDIIRQLSAHLGGDVQQEADAEQVLPGDLEAVPSAVVRRRCRKKTRASLAPAVELSLPESRKRKLSADTGVRTSLARCDTQSPRETMDQRPKKQAETEKRWELDAQSQTEEQCLRKEPKAKCKSKQGKRARYQKELKHERAEEQVHCCIEVDVNAEKVTTDARHQQEAEKETVLERLGDHGQNHHAIQDSPEDFARSLKSQGPSHEKQRANKESVAKRHYVPDAQCEQNLLRTGQKLETKRTDVDELVWHARKTNENETHQCQKLPRQCNKEEMSLLQVLEAKYTKQDDARRRKALEVEQLAEGNEISQQQAQHTEEESCVYQEVEDECRNDQESTRCQQDNTKEGWSTGTELKALGKHETLQLVEPEVRSRSADAHGRSYFDFQEPRHQESDPASCQKVEVQSGSHHYKALRSNCKQEESQLQALEEADKCRDYLALVSTPQRGRTGDAGRQWRSQWRRLSLLPVPEVPSSLLPLPGGDVWAAAAMQRAAEEGNKIAPASPVPEQNKCSSVPSTPGCPHVPKSDEKPVTGSLVEDSEPGFFDYGQMAISQAAKKLVSLSVAAAEMDETARCARLVDLSTGMIHPLPDGGIVAIGHSIGCDIVLAFPIIDSRHCVLVCNEGNVVVEDVGSKETFVNEMLVPRGDLLPQRVPLLRGDILALGHPDGPKFLFLNAGRPSASSFGGA